MKTLYLECNMGAAGDMLSAALLELLPDPAAFVDRLNSLAIPGVIYRKEAMDKCGIRCTHMAVMVNGDEEESADVSHEHSGHDHEHMHGHDHEHKHEHELMHMHEHTHDHDHEHEHEHTKDRDHNYDHGYEHNHDHDHNHDHGHDHDYDHDHDHGHDHHHHHTHHSLHDIAQIVSALEIPEQVQKDIMAVYTLLAEAEGHVHARPVEEIHFHEVGTMDAIADVTAFCLLLHELAPERIIASPVHVGSGNVRCAHGILPVPAPATAYLLRDLPSYGGEVCGELCTPTGAALLRYFVQDFGPQPVMRVEKIGYGCGKKDFARAHCVRAMLGQTAEEGEQVLELRCNLDDMTPEAIGFAMERLFDAGALDVYTVAVGMKKNRPGVLLTCMCAEERREDMVHLLFLHTTTLGVRVTRCGRYTLRRSTETRETPQGQIRVKKADGWGVARAKPEYEDLAAIARRENISLQQAADLLRIQPDSTAGG